MARGAELVAPLKGGCDAGDARLRLGEQAQLPLNHRVSVDGAKTAIVGMMTALSLDRTLARNVHVRGRGDLLSMATCFTLHLARI